MKVWPASLVVRVVRMAVSQEAPLAPFFLPTVATASTLAFVAPSTTVTAGDVAAAAAASTTTHLPAWSDDSEEEDGVCVLARGWQRGYGACFGEERVRVVSCRCCHRC